MRIEMKQQLEVTKTLIGQADDIAAAHEQFTTHYVVGGRMALYTLLGEMLKVVNSFESAADREDLLELMKRRLRSEFGIKTQQNSSDTAVLIRYMTRADRKTAHVYTRVLESAKQSGVSPEQLPAFIEGAGGVERIRALSSNSSVASNQSNSDERIALTKQYLRCREELPLASFDATDLIDQITPSDARYSYFTCIRKADGKFYVLSPLPANAEFEQLAISQLSEAVCKDQLAASEGIARLRTYLNQEVKAECIAAATGFNSAVTI